MVGWIRSQDHVGPKSYPIVLSWVLLGSLLWARPPQQPFVSQTPPPQSPAEPVPAASTPRVTPDTPSDKPSPLVLPEATPVKLKLLHTLNSKTVVEGDPLNFALAENLIVNDQLAVKAGAVAIGRVSKAKPARTLGRGGQLLLEMQYLKVGRTRVPLRGSQGRAGENKKGETVALVALFGLSGLIKHGSEIEVKEGSIVTAYVDQDTELPVRVEAVTQVR